MRNAVLLLLVVVLLGADAPTTKPFPRVPPVEPKDAVKTFRALEGFHMDLIAAEPLVTGPVAIAYDENGLAYVCEMNDYPYTDKAHHKAFAENPTDQPIGRIRVLEDTNGNGVYDKSWVFAEGLSWPTGIICWDGGVYVMATPDLWYFKSTKGDHHADVRRKVFTGFKKFNVQAVANNLIWGLDGRIYGAGGSNGGTISTPGHPLRKPTTLSHNDFRFDPRTEEFEPIAGGARFGNTFDDWGNRFVCNIRNPAQHLVMESRYLARNPYLPVPSVVHDVAESGDAIPVYRTSPYEQWRDERGRRWSTDGTVMPRSELVAGGVVTSSSGVTIYRGGAYPPQFKNYWFLGEPANNLILRQAMTADGVTFTSKRIDDRVDFITSTDIWCRPVNFANAPDGTLHVCDMYREVIEHPWSIPDDIHARLDLESGRDRGRIYRLTPPGFVVPKQPKLGSATTEQLAAELANPNAWWRETAQRLILQRQEGAVEVRKLLETGSDSLGRLHALWTLADMGQVNERDIERAFVDPAAGVRENAVRVAETHLRDFPKLIERVLKLAEDQEIRVRFQTALTLGESTDPRVPDALVSILRRDVNDPRVPIAVLSSCVGRADGMLAKLVADEAFTASPAGREVLRKLALVTGARNQTAEIDRAVGSLSATASLPVKLSVLAGLGEGLKRNKKTLRQTAPAAAEALLAEAYRLAADDKAVAADREPAIHLIGLDDFSHSRAALDELLDSRQPQEVQRAAVAALAGNNQPQIGAILLARWPSYTPPVRADVMSAVLGYKPRILALLDAVEKKEVDVRDVPSGRRASLMRSTDPDIHQRAAKLFAIDPAGDRKAAINRYMRAVEMKGNPEGGRKVYEAICIACHRLGDRGNDVGPNLATVRLWSPEQLLVNILDPNREVAPAFTEYTIDTNDGESLSGIIADENASGVTLKWAGGMSRTLARSEITKITASRLSLMPEGLEANISIEQMADLIALLRGQK